MQWTDLLSTARLSGSATQHRNEFDDDYKRIVTSPSFRRLQDKTQVFPLERMDFIHTRLTHSLEVAMIGRTLVSEIALSLADQLEVVADSELAVSQQEFIVRQADIARIVECASLLHDIGNPPYGHFGEDIIRQWFKKRLPVILSEQLDPQLAQDFLASDYVHDLYHFEGNAQALRIAAKLHDFKGSFVGLGNSRTIGRLHQHRGTRQPSSQQPSTQLHGFHGKSSNGSHHKGFENFLPTVFASRWLLIAVCHATFSLGVRLFSINVISRLNRHQINHRACAKQSINLVIFAYMTLQLSPVRVVSSMFLYTEC